MGTSTLPPIFHTRLDSNSETSARTFHVRVIQINTNTIQKNMSSEISDPECDVHLAVFVLHLVREKR